MSAYQNPCRPTVLGILLSVFCCWPALPAAPPGTLPENPGEREKLVASGDLHLLGPARQPEQGLPLGNGRMGSMVWTTPVAIHLQINRPDVYASDKDSTSFPEPHKGYCGGCAFVDLDFGAAADIFTAENTRQDISIYQGLATLTGKDLTARMIAHPAKDVIAIEISGARANSENIRAILRMLRPAQVKTFDHSAISVLREDQGPIMLTQKFKEGKFQASEWKHSRVLVLTQEFKEGQFLCRTAVAVAVAGPDSTVDRIDDLSIALRLSLTQGTNAAPISECTTLYVASAATFDPDYDVEAEARRLVGEAEMAGFDRLAARTAGWWRDFWQGTYVKLAGTDASSAADAALVQSHYYYFLYLMGASSRGPLPPKFNGMLWNTCGDPRMWGDMHWWHNVSCFYDALPATGKWDLMDPMYDMYSGMLPSCEQAARDAWGSAGVWIPETVCFNGPPALPAEIAAELRAFLLNRKPASELSEEFKAFASRRNPHFPCWNWLEYDCWKAGQFGFRPQSSAPFSYTSHILSSGAKIAGLFWTRYEYTRDKAWLRTRAWPLIRGTAEFYRNFPNLQLEADGRYHIHHVNNHEPTWGAQDTIHELGAMYGLLPVAIRASEILDVDADLRAKWHDLLVRLAPLPTTDHPQALHPRKPEESVRWDVGLSPVVKGKSGWGGTEPMVFWNLCTVETTDPQTAALAAATYARTFKPGSVGPLSLQPVMSANMGRGEDLGATLVAQLTNPLVYPNRLCNVEGGYNVLPGTSAEHEGRAAQGLLRGLLLAAPPAPGEDCVVRLFAALPAAWDGEFQLHAPGGFVISTTRTHGSVQHVTVESRLGENLRLHNPWPGSSVKVSRNGKPAPSLAGDLLTIPTAAGEALRLTQE